MINCNENVNEKTDYIVNRPRHRSTHKYTKHSMSQDDHVCI